MLNGWYIYLIYHENQPKARQASKIFIGLGKPPKKIGKSCCGNPVCVYTGEPKGAMKKRAPGWFGYIGD